MSKSLLGSLLSASDENDALLNSPNEWLRSFARRARNEASVLEELRDSILNALGSLGIMEMQLEYHGGGDSGDIEEVAWYPATISAEAMLSKYIDMVQYVAGWHDQKPKCVFIESRVTIKEAIDCFFWTTLSTQFPGWEINEGGMGVLAFDLTDNTVTLYHTQYYQQSEEHIVEL